MSPYLEIYVNVRGQRPEVAKYLRHVAEAIEDGALSGETGVAWEGVLGRFLTSGAHGSAESPLPEPEPDPYAELKAAHAAGKVIQFRFVEGGYGWEDDASETPPYYRKDMEFRVKPDPVPLAPEVRVKVIQFVIGPNDSRYQGRIIGLGSDGALYYEDSNGWSLYLPAEILPSQKALLSKPAP